MPRTSLTGMKMSCRHVTWRLLATTVKHTSLLPLTTPGQVYFTPLHLSKLLRWHVCSSDTPQYADGEEGRVEGGGGGGEGNG